MIVVLPRRVDYPYTTRLSIGFPIVLNFSFNNSMNPKRQSDNNNNNNSNDNCNHNHHHHNNKNDMF